MFVIWVISVSLFIIFKPQPVNNLSYEAKIADLHTIEIALYKIINTQSVSERKMPKNLREAGLNNLQGRLEDYEYFDANSTRFGGDYTLCTYFKEQGEEKPEENFTYGGIEAYKFHDKGRSCFRNSVYKGSSHIKPL